MTKARHLLTFMTLPLMAISCTGPSRSSLPDASLAIVELLADEKPVFGIFSGPKTGEQAAFMAMNREIDFVFYSLETGPFDLDTFKVYRQGMIDAVGTGDAQPVALRIPPIRDGKEAARNRAQLALAAGVDAIVFPHVEDADTAAFAVRVVRSGLRMLIIEDRVGVANATAIANTPGIDVVFAGPGDLRRAYEGDMAAVEAAIQEVLAASKAAGVPCGITAGPEDIAARIEQGFQVFIVSDPAAIAIGRSVAGR